jgi:hypothetical protein
MARPPMKQGLYGMVGPGGRGAGFTGYMWRDRSGVTPAGKGFGGQFHALDAKTAGLVRKEYASGAAGPEINRLMGVRPPPNPGWGQSPPPTSYMGGFGMGGRSGGGTPSMGAMRGRRRGAFNNYMQNLRQPMV